MEKEWQDSYYDGDDLVAQEEVVWALDEHDDEWYDDLIPHVWYVDEDTWDWLIKYLEEDDESGLE